MVTKKDILNKVNELTDLIKSKEYEQLKRDSEELKQIKELISHIKFKIRNVDLISDDTIQVVYELPRINLIMDENGKLSKNDFFYATNFLEMISLEDMNKFQVFVNKIKSQKGQKWQ